MRGKLASALVDVEELRIIPAHAGQTVGSFTVSVVCSDHPRACGANQQTNRTLSGNSGSSPRMRGKQRALFPLPPDARIIPAHAGQTRRKPWAPHTSSDHPRACGANSLIPLAKRTPTIREKFDLHSRSHFANVIMVPNFLMSTRNPQFNIATTTIYQNGDIVMHCSNLFYEMHPEISRWIHPDHEAS